MPEHNIVGVQTLSTMNGIRVVAVAVAGTDHDWAVYCGGVPVDVIPPTRSVHEDAWQEVAEHGDKLPVEWAAALFPHLAERSGLIYRE
jgi:hypothetical protein